MANPTWRGVCPDCQAETTTKSHLDVADPNRFPRAFRTACPLCERGMQMRLVEQPIAVVKKK